MSSTSKMQALRKVLAVSFLFGAGGCFVLNYDFDKQPPKECVTAVDCPGKLTECGTPTCDQGICGWTGVRPAGELPPGQAIGDCKIGHCDGQGNLVFETDPTDLPNDGNECTDDLCVQGTPTNPPSSDQTSCGTMLNLKCNGAGVCAGCMMPMDCGVDTTCKKWACDEEAKCGLQLEPIGTLAENPLPGDCKANLCDAQGNPKEEPYPEDPAVDENDCTIGVCNTDGTTAQNQAPNGTPCGDMPCMACTNGTCDVCQGDFYCNVDKCSPKQQLPVGAACADSIDCAMGSCVDGVCCDGPCAGACSACSNAKTGQPNGTCAPVADGSDPDNDCSAPAADVCVGGKCQCYNGVKDPSELKVDCGGNCNPCPGTWVCDGAQGCNGAPETVCCGIFCVGCLGGESNCKDVQGQPCNIGDSNKKFGVLENNGSCEQCGSITCICQ